VSPTGQRIVTRIRDTIRELDDEASGDCPPERRRDVQSRAAGLSEVLRWLPQQIVIAEAEAIIEEYKALDRLEAVLA